MRFSAALSRALVPALAGFAAAFALACSSPTPATSCTGDANCSSDERCVADLCEPVVCDPGCTANFACQHGSCACVSDAACTTDEACDPSGACVPKVTKPECTSDAGCTGGTVCENNVCVAAPSCSADADCSGSRVCEAGSCVAGCAADADCGSPAQAWACETGHCIARCLQDAGCATGEICEQGGLGGICRPADCATASDCGASSTICSDPSHGRCETVTACSQPSDCAASETCGLPSPCPPGYDCSAGNEYCIGRTPCGVDADCGANQFCDQGFCFDASNCTAPSDCTGGFDCIGGICVPGLCRGPADCLATEVCAAGSCVSKGATTAVDRVTILSPAGFLLTGETRQLIAVAYDANGDAISGATITWSSSAPGSVDVDPAGLAVGGSTPGVATITAASGGLQDTVELTALAAPSGDLRVEVVDGENGVPVSTATVRVVQASGPDLETSVDAGGVATFAGGATGPFTVHVFDAVHDYVSLFELSELDVLVPLPPRSDPALAGGMTGAMSYANVSSVGDASVGLAGLSFGQALTDLDLGSVMGDTFVVQIPGLGQSVPLPGGMTAQATFGGFPISLKTTWYAQGEPGLRAVWAFAGKVGLDRFQGGGGGGAAQTLAGILPLFGIFEHGLVPRVLVAEQATVVDSADIDGDGDTTELLPNWTAFPSRTMAPAQSQTLRVFVDPAAMPALGTGTTDTVVLLAGVRSGRLGLTPLGLTATELASPSDTKAPAVTMSMAPVYGGLEVGDYQLLAMAVNTSGTGLGGAGPSEASVRVVTRATLPGNLTLPAFLPFPEATSYDTGSRTLSAEAALTASLHRDVVEGAGRRWVVYGPATGGSWTLPMPPTGMDDPGTGSGGLTVGVVELSAGDYQAMSGAAGSTLQQLDALTAGYARLKK